MLHYSHVKPDLLVYNREPMNSDFTPVSVVIPVYRNLAATQRCIEAVLGSELGPGTRVIIIDDDSPEPEISSWCQQQDTRKAVTVLRNDENLGFVATVNRGIEASGDTDVVLLNSDTEVANNWLERLQNCAYSGAAIGTVTPLSNNASVCSYPAPLKENALPEGWPLQALDALVARVNQGKSVELPTAVGFCMYIRRACLDAVGVFDEENFGIGYGEECDFSMRAKSAGWLNLLSADVFVYHEGGQSFTSQTKDRICAAEETLRRLHPQYHVLATRFIDEDPIRVFRDTIDLARIAQSPQDSKSIIIGLQSYRDTLLGSKTNRELSLEHAFGEVTSERNSLSEKFEEAVVKSVSVEADLVASRGELSARTERLESTSNELTLAQKELLRLQQDLLRVQLRDRRWRYLMYFVNRLDAVRLCVSQARKPQ